MTGIFRHTVIAPSISVIILSFTVIAQSLSSHPSFTICHHFLSVTIYICRRRHRRRRRARTTSSTRTHFWGGCSARYSLSPLCRAKLWPRSEFMFLPCLQGETQAAERFFLKNVPAANVAAFLGICFAEMVQCFSKSNVTRKFAF